MDKNNAIAWLFCFCFCNQRFLFFLVLLHQIFKRNRHKSCLNVLDFFFKKSYSGDVAVEILLRIHGEFLNFFAKQRI